jgi:hypothetical protein
MGKTTCKTKTACKKKPPAPKKKICKTKTCKVGSKAKRCKAGWINPASFSGYKKTKPTVKPFQDNWPFCAKSAKECGTYPRFPGNDCKIGKNEGWGVINDKGKCVNRSIVNQRLLQKLKNLQFKSCGETGMKYGDTCYELEKIPASLTKRVTAWPNLFTPRGTATGWDVYNVYNPAFESRRARFNGKVKSGSNYHDRSEAWLDNFEEHDKVGVLGQLQGKAAPKPRAKKGAAAAAAAPAAGASPNILPVVRGRRRVEPKEGARQKKGRSPSQDLSKLGDEPGRPSPTTPNIFQRGGDPSARSLDFDELMANIER